MRSLHQRTGLALAWRPEWPIAMLAGLAWMIMLVPHVVSTLGVPAHHHGRSPPALASGTVASSIGGWALMSVAMMVPVTLPAVRHVAINSLRRRRQRAIVVYTAAYVTVWIVFGVVAIALVDGLTSLTGITNPWVGSASLAVAATWQMTRWKRRAVLACHRTVPLPPFGMRADAACAQFAFRQAGRCLVSCWPLMLLMAIVGHTNIVAMTILTSIFLVEQYAQKRKRTLKPIAITLAVGVFALPLFG